MEDQYEQKQNGLFEWTQEQSLFSYLLVYSFSKVSWNCWDIQAKIRNTENANALSFIKLTMS